jgi:hypothetical protein
MLLYNQRSMGKFDILAKIHTIGIEPRASCHVLSSLNIIIESVSFDFCGHVCGNRVWKASAFKVLTWKIATNDNPAEKSAQPSSITASSGTVNVLL